MTRGAKIRTIAGVVLVSIPFWIWYGAVVAVDGWMFPTVVAAVLFCTLLGVYLLASE